MSDDDWKDDIKAIRDAVAPERYDAPLEKDNTFVAIIRAAGCAIILALPVTLIGSIIFSQGVANLVIWITLIGTWVSCFLLFKK